MPLAAAQRLYVKTLPELVAANLDPATVATGFTVYPRAGADPEAIAAEIRATLPDLEPMTGKDFDRQIGSATSILNSILVGIALISLAVGGLSVINTMAMSVAERTREIGIKRAIGGGRLRIVRELVTESALIGFLGGAIGLALGAVLVTAGQRGWPLVRHRALPADDRHRVHGGRLLDRPRRARRPHPRHARRAARSGHRASLRMTSTQRDTENER